MSYFDDNEDYLIYRLGYNSFKRKPTRPRVVVTADDFEDLTAEPAEVAGGAATEKQLKDEDTSDLV